MYSQTYINFSNVLRAHDVIIIMKFNLLYLLLQESKQGVLEQFTCVFATEYDILIDTNKIFFFESKTILYACLNDINELNHFKYTTTCITVL